MDILALNAENLQIKTENKFIYDMLSFSVEKNTIYLYSIQHFIFDMLQHKIKHNKKHLKQASTP